MHMVRLPFDEPFVVEKIVKAKKTGEKSLIIDLSGKTLNDYNRWRNTIGNLSFGTDFGPETHWIIHIAFFSKGVLSFSSYTSCPPETLQLLERFAGVFDLTYTRFNDLQKAEAQVREAQIEAALERVRSRSMAMHKTDELLEAAELVHRELAALGIDSMNVSYAIIDEDKKSASYYSVNPVNGKIP